MQLTKVISARVDETLKRKLMAEVARRRKRGEGIDPADIIREAIIVYLENLKLKGAA